ncbi:hypothetical protein COHA_003844 [Chlorella ohadii]|uniref:Uncharacterized protein n=1 Tax=Chlorella ohadii TaxID=2649997 RepID=A0AAD5DUS3_9CHLO|nr:hypothetical protein COHA_003844 [Chlorella ohadii]
MARMLRSTIFLAKGLREFTRGGYERAAKRFDEAVLQRSLAGRRAMVTGANQGLGYQTSLELAKRGATLYMVCRNEERGREAVERVRRDSGNSDVHLKARTGCFGGVLLSSLQLTILRPPLAATVDQQVCDLASLAAIRALAEEWLASGAPLDLLVNNAGLMLHERTPSADGYETNFAVNTLGAFALTAALEPALHAAGQPAAGTEAAAAGAAAGAAGSSGGPAGARVIFVSSGGQYTEPLEVEDLEAKGWKKFDGTRQYARDKRRQIAIAERFNERWEAAGKRTRAYAMHPGWTETDGVKTSIPGFYNAFKNKLRNLQQGCDTTVWLCLEDDSKLQPGGFYLDRQPQAKHLPLAGTSYSSADVDRMWTALAQLAAPALPHAQQS